MFEFIVELPIFLRFTTEAPDPDAAAAAAEAMAFELTSQPPSLFRHADPQRGAVVTSSQLQPDPDGTAPDVYICRGGKLNDVFNGEPRPTGEDCPLAIKQP